MYDTIATVISMQHYNIILQYQIPYLPPTHVHSLSLSLTPSSPTHHAVDDTLESVLSGSDDETEEDAVIVQVVLDEIGM